ncbi:OB-fold protein [Flavobacterium flavipallidum]|uniref:tRNA_anti-like n=1 Tax=Flavobacterium flavipallidum TaxID=3139140 RepID=A0ABU9HMD4_9FLAO
MKKTLIIPLLAISFVGLSSYYYVMHGGSRDLKSETASYCVSSSDIASEFTANLDNSNKKYLEKAVAITGTITKLQDSLVTLDHSIICVLKNPDSQIKKNQTVVIKGRVVGYDDLLGELKLDQCFISK